MVEMSETRSGKHIATGTWVRESREGTQRSTTSLLQILH